MKNDLRTPWEIYRFDVLSKHCKQCGLNDLETTFVILSGSHICPLEDDIKAFRQWQSRGIVPHTWTPGFEALKRGKAQLESTGDLCSNHVRKTEYFSGNHNLGWEGMEYWNCYPLWFRKKVLGVWHPDFKKTKKKKKKKK